MPRQTATWPTTRCGSRASSPSRCPGRPRRRGCSRCCCSTGRASRRAPSTATSCCSDSRTALAGMPRSSPRRTRALRRAAELRRPGRWQLHAAIAACHADAATAAETDWLQVLILYDMLLAYDRSPVVRLNRSVALAEVAGPGVALTEVDALGERSRRLPPVARRARASAARSRSRRGRPRRRPAGDRADRERGRAAAASRHAGRSDRSLVSGAGVRRRPARARRRRAARASSCRRATGSTRGGPAPTRSRGRAARRHRR